MDIGVYNFWHMADTRNHKHHGSFGAFVAQPRGSVSLILRKEMCWKQVLAPFLQIQFSFSTYL